MLFGQLGSNSHDWVESFLSTDQGHMIVIENGE